jgi:hypothetical protein
MRALPGQEAVQQAACQALERLACDDDGMRVKIAEAGGLVAIVASMQAHKTSAGVQEPACGALWNLSVNTANEVAVAAAGGIEAVLAEMATHQANAGVEDRERY